MEYKIYKFTFPSGVHFGNGMLNDSDSTFGADVLFSAMYIEALKMHLEEDFFQSIKEGKIVISDAFPFLGDRYLLPKPRIHIQTENQGDSVKKKAAKKLKYIDIEKIEEFFAGNYNFSEDPYKEFGSFSQQIMAAVRNGQEDTLPYYVGKYSYKDGNGLYVIVGFQDEKSAYLFEDLLDSLHYFGIGGKKNSGLGKFDFTYGKNIKSFEKYLNGNGKHKYLLSGALPKKEELKRALDGASYSLKKRSGFIYSDTYAAEERKKRDMYLFEAGSCFKIDFEGDVYDVSEDGNHPVYRYARAMFLEV